MFTGLIDDIGTIEAADSAPAGRTFRVRCGYEDLSSGESIALNGACLTVRSHGPGWFTVAAIATTLERTNLASWRAGTRVNLERALRAGARLGGHIVLGHVDDVGTVVAQAQRDDAWLVDIGVPPELNDVFVPHGSLAMDGVSLTVNECPAPNVVQVSLIEYTLQHTTLGALLVGDSVHIEADVIGKYVRQLVAPYIAGVGGGFRHD
jgi:riboflavin synthase